jgi:hypothetical protein
MLAKRNELLGHRKVRIKHRALRQKPCVACGNLFVPSFSFSLFCAFCTAPTSSFLTIPQENIHTARTA